MRYGMGTYSTTEFAKKANVSVRTIRYYDNIGLLKPSNYDEVGGRCYSEKDFFQLQKILSLKFFGFSLKEIEELLCDRSSEEIRDFFNMQVKLVQKKIDNLKQVEKGLIDAKHIIESQGELRWENVINLLYLMDMEEQLLQQYQNSENIAIRIKLHSQFSANKLGWFPWLFHQIEIKEGSKILEIGCGNGELWKSISKEILKKNEIILSDISAGMIRDAMSNLKEFELKYSVFDCNDIPFLNDDFNIVIANHMLFYIKNISGALNEVVRVLNANGVFYCSTYGENHMKEISEMVKAFDSKINLSEIELYKIFGLENGQKILEEHFEEVSLKIYDDHLEIDDVEVLCDYIYSCHGNQNHILAGRKNEFKEFMQEKMRKNKLIISKHAGVFICRKPKKELVPEIA